MCSRIVVVLAVFAVLFLSVARTSLAQEAARPLVVDALVVVDGALVPAGTEVGIFANGQSCLTGTTQPRGIPFTTGSVLRAQNDSPAAACASGSLVARTNGKSSGAIARDPAGAITGLLMIGRPVSLIEGTAEQTGVPQSAPDVQLVVGTGPDQRICARAKVVPPVPTAAATDKPIFSELLFDEAQGCARFGDTVDLYVGDTFARSIVLTPGLQLVNLSVVRTINPIDTGMSPPPRSLPSTGAARVDRGGDVGRTGRVVVASGAVLGLASLAYLACVLWRSRRIAGAQD